ncbi:MAG: hypothetical protein CMN55_10910 [Sneathiella sp.]|jgi:acetyl esterase|uniref:alpha/beta hydrolase n=1 Tax=Sneathiella sp. TaxID=1964365 RepID=UPI000C61F01D|nr:alpha/beta hydrolase [Sneathiella sp.]MAL79603.1 hypothetical protein [Sneathiella sp.]
MLERLIAALLAALPSSFFSLFYGFRPLVIDGQKLDAKARLLCDLDRKSASPVTIEGLAENREKLEKVSSLLAGKPPRLPSIQDITIRSGSDDFPARLYRPLDEPSLPVLVYYHGGGYIRGSLDSHDGLCARLAKYGGFAVLSVGYRLAPEARFPAAVEDSCAALRWVSEKGTDYGLDSSRLAVGGDSSGGCLAAVVAQQAASQGGPLPLFQMLFYPTLDAHLSAPSHAMFADGFFLTRARMEGYRDMYLNNASERDDIRASPILNTDLAGLPPALIVTAGFDPLRDEAEEYGKALQAAGVNVGVVRFPAMVHGFMSMTGVFPEAEKALHQAADALAHVFAVAAQDNNTAD